MRIAALLLATFAVYGNALFGSFQFDDFNVIVNNPTVHSWSAYLQDLPHGIRPLLKLSYLLNWLADPAPFGFHLVNLAIHLTNVFLVFILVHYFAKPDQFAAHLPLWKDRALITAALFALHPLQTEAVSYICGRSTSLMTLFYLGSITADLNARELKSRLLQLLSPLLFICALLTKESAVTLPLALLVIEICRTKGEKPGSRFQRQWPHWLILLAGFMTLIFHPRYLSLLTVSLETRSISQNLLTQLHALAYLISRLLLPFNLSIDPDLPVVTAVTFSAGLGGLLIGATLIAGICSIRRSPLLALGILWFFLHLLPTNSFLPRLDVVNDRQFYLPGIGLFFLAASAFDALSAKNPGLRPTLQLLLWVVMITLGGATVRRNLDYRTEITLWEQTVRVSPRKARAFNNLGYAYAQNRQYAKAIQAYKRAIALKPDYGKAVENLRDAEEGLQRETAGKWLFRGVIPPVGR